MEHYIIVAESFTGFSFVWTNRGWVLNGEPIEFISYALANKEALYLSDQNTDDWIMSISVVHIDFDYSSSIVDTFFVDYKY